MNKISPNLNALTAIGFWRSYRNQAVHLSRLVTRTFHAKYGAFFAEAMDCFGHIRLVPGAPLPFHDDLYRAMAAAGTVTLPNRARNKSAGMLGSRRSDDVAPRLHRRGPEGSVRFCRGEMALDVESVVSGCVG